MSIKNTSKIVVVFGRGRCFCEGVCVFEFQPFSVWKLYKEKDRMIQRICYRSDKKVEKRLALIGKLRLCVCVLREKEYKEIVELGE